MGKSREIKKRMRAVSNIRRITRTMQMIATSKFARAQQRSVAGRPYTDSLFELVQEVTSRIENPTHPLLSVTEEEVQGKPELTLILTSDRGLCGPYNGSILRTALAHLRQNDAAMNGQIELVGKKGVNFLKFNKIPVTRHYTHFGDHPSYDDIERLADDYMDRFLTRDISAVRVVYMRYISAGRQRPEVLQLLPFSVEAPAKPEDEPAAGHEAETGAAPSAPYEFSPGESELLAELLPAAVRIVLFQAFKDAIVSEHVARMVAMKAATDNAGKMGRRLNREFNRARQAQITTELTEIISGAQALE